MQTKTVLPSLARCSAPRFGTGAVAVPRHARAQPCAVLMRPATGRRPISLGPIRHAFVNPRALHHSGGSVPAKRRGHITTSASSGRPGLNEFPVADRRVELDKMTMAQLKPLCKGSGLKQGGKKQELVSRLLVNEFGTTDDEADIDPTQDIVGLAVEWRQGRSVGASGVSFRESDSVDRALKTSGFVDERAADANFGWKQGFDDGGYSRSSEARGDQHANSGQRESAAARVMGRTGGGFDDGAGSGWATDDDWYDREKEDAERYNDAQAKTPPQRTPEERKEEKKELERVQRMSLQRRAAIVTALRTLATEREGFEADPRVHLSAVAVAIEKAYRAMKYSAFAKMDDRGRDVLVDINVATGTLAILAQKITRAGTVEWEVDDTDAFLEAHGKRHQMRKLAFTFTEEIDEAVSAAAAESYTTREGEMITAEVVAVGPGGEVLLKMRDGAFACLPAEEAIPDKRYVQGDSVSALVVGVELRTWAADKRAPVIVSQAIAGLLAEVFKAEVPEVLRGDVVIKSVARVSGKMSKVAVALRDGAAASGVTFDPVLACLGEDSVRMRAIRERMGGEAVQVLPWRSDPCEFVAEALFPAVVKDVVQSDKAGSLDERGFPRRMSKFIAYVSRFDEAKAIGAAGLNVKLAAALCGCFIMVERYEDGGVSSQGNGFGFDSRGGDTRGGWNDQATTRDDTRWNERDDRDDGWRGDTRENNRDDWRDDTRENARDDWRDNDSRKTVGIDIGDDGLDDLGWPDLVSPPGPAGRGALSNTLGSNSDSFSAETSAEFAADAEAVIFADTRTFNDDGDDDANWEEVGPGKVGVVTFGGNLGAGITGGCSFMGDQEEEEAERLGDVAAAATANRVKSPPAAGAADTLSFLDDDDDLDLDDELLEMDGDTLAEDELFGEDWS